MRFIEVHLMQLPQGLCPDLFSFSGQNFSPLPHKCGAGAVAELDQLLKCAVDVHLCPLTSEHSSEKQNCGPQTAKPESVPCFCSSTFFLLVPGIEFRTLHLHLRGRRWNC